MKTYRFTTTLDIDADNEDEAWLLLDDEGSRASWNCEERIGGTVGFEMPLIIDIAEIDKQINAVLLSNILPDVKDGLHNLLGSIKDEAIEAWRESNGQDITREG